MRKKIDEMLKNFYDYPVCRICDEQLPEAWRNSEEKIDCFIMRANGKGMRKAGIDDGDLVFFKKIEIPRHNSLIAAMLEDGAVVIRRYLEIDGNQILRRENGRTPDLINPKFEAFGEVYAVHRIIGQGA